MSATTPKRTPKKRQAAEIDHSQDETKEEKPQWLVDKNEHKKKTQQEKRVDGNNDAHKVKEGAKVDRMVKHVAQSEKKLGHGKKEAENIAWATANKRGMLNNKNKKA